MADSTGTIGKIQQKLNVGNERGTRLFIGGVTALLFSVVFATFPRQFTEYTWMGWEIAGLLAGVGVPATLIGVMVTLETDHDYLRPALIGTGIMILGTLLFLGAFPYKWHGDTTDYTALVTSVYFLGAITTLVYMFAGVANSDVKIERIPFVPETANTPPEPHQQDSMETTLSSGGSDSGMNVSDDVMNADEDDGVILGEEDEKEPIPSDVDKYCGNCVHFDYVETGRGIEPYCARYDEVMQDTEPCVDWKPNKERVPTESPR